jgi:tripartite-type tricarboxylate transporter receptor subunit TctC
VTGVGIGQALPFIKAGKLRPIVMLADRRSPLLPDLPTVSETVVPGYDYGSYTGFFAPGATPAAIVSRLNENFIKVLKMPDVKSRLEADGNEIIGNTSAQFRQMIVNETNAWTKVVQEAGIKLEL